MTGKCNSPLRNMRRVRTLTQGELADLAGIQQDQLSRAERGQITLRRDVQERLAAILGVPRTELFPETDTVTA